MRLLHTSTRQVHTFTYPPPVEYAIFSHTWSSPHDDEWSLYNPEDSDDNSIRREIILRVCDLAQGHNLDYVWIDAECIDKTSSADVSTAINLLPRYFERAAVCFAFLVDLPCGASIPSKDTWAQCRFWTRAWTLQELILPSKIQFYDARWHLRGERSSQPLYSLIAGITGIDEEVLNHQRTLQQTSIARKMSWAACREASSPEDTTYALLGLFDVCLPIVYGEGESKAFRRLQEEILKNSNDSSLFAWTSTHDEDHRGIFANSPGEFLAFGQQDYARLPFNFNGFAALTSRGVLVSGQASKQGSNIFLELGVKTEKQSKRLGILLRERPDGTFERTSSSKVQKAPISETATIKQVMVFRGHIDAVRNSAHVIRSNMDDDAHVASYTRVSLPISLKRPSTPEIGTPPDQQCQSDTTPTGSNPNNADQWPRNDLDWVSIRDESYECPTSDDSDEDYCSMGMSQQTNAGYERAASVMSNPTTVASPPQSEPEPAFYDCTPVNYEINESKVGPLTSSENLEMGAADNYEDIVYRLSRILLDQFSVSQDMEPASRLSERNRRKMILKRSKANKRQPRRAQKIRRTTIPEPFEFSCPFFKNNPERYVNCLGHELKTMADVRGHLWQQHRLPPYCPTCKHAFAYAFERDEHIVQRSCAFQGRLPHDGVSEDQKRLISRTQRSHGGRTQWCRVWDILFPDTSLPPSPYLRSGLGLRVSDLRAFWRERGPELLGNCLRDWFPAEPSLLDEQGLQNLSSEVLAEAVAAVLAAGSARGSTIRSTADASSTTHTMWAESEF